MMGTELTCDLPHQRQVSNGIDAVDLDDQAFECGILRHLSTQILDRRRGLEKRDWQIDGEFHRTMPFHEMAPILDRPADHELGQGTQMRITIIRNEVGRRDDTPGWMTNANEALRLAQRQRA